MDSTLANAFLNKPHRACGFDLAPLTLRHAFVLEAIESPLALGAARDFSFEDLFAAAALCSTRNESELQAHLFRPPLTQEQAAALHTQADTQRPLYRLHLRAWNAYLRNHTALPRLLPVPGAQPWQCHYLLVTVAKLMKEGHLSEEAAWWTPFARARWLTLALDELNPNVKFKLRNPDLDARLRRLGHEVT